MPPPPPPPGPPPPPTFNLGGGDTRPGKKEAESRSLLLSSIRQGTQLKKAVTNDRSSPLIDGKSSNKSSSGGDFTRTNGAPPGLGGLFAGGMPKLKSVGQHNAELSSVVSPLNKKNTAPSPPTGRANLRLAQVPATNSFPGTTKRGVNSDRGPAPQPPPSSNKPIISGSTTIPRRGPPLPNKPPVQINKPTTGLRPAHPGNKPVPPLKGPSLPAHPPNLRRPASLGEHDYRNGQLVKGNVLTSSASKLNGATTNQHPPSPSGESTKSTRNLVAQFNSNQINQQKHVAPPIPPLPITASGVNSSRMAAPPPPIRTTTAPRPPGSKPPPPPIKGPVTVGGGNWPNAPNAFSTHLATPPPPPPHRTASTSSLSNQSRMQPPPPPPTGQPPPPPVRHASTRSSSCPPNRKTSGDDFESRFFHKFRSKAELPPPDPFENCLKTYSNSRRNPAPPPPPPPPHQNQQQHPHHLHLQLGNIMYIRQESKC